MNLTSFPKFWTSAPTIEPSLRAYTTGMFVPGMTAGTHIKFGFHEFKHELVLNRFSNVRLSSHTLAPLSVSQALNALFLVYQFVLNNDS